MSNDHYLSRSSGEPTIYGPVRFLSSLCVLGGIQCQILHSTNSPRPPTFAEHHYGGRFLAFFKRYLGTFIELLYNFNHILSFHGL